MSVYQQIIDSIRIAEHIVITAHQSPDGDSIGSSLGLYRFIQKLGKQVVVCHPDQSPSNFNWLSDINDIIIFNKSPSVVIEKIKNADLLICLDYNKFSRTGVKMQRILEQFNKKTILIDHHIDPTINADLILNESDCCSTSQLIYQTIKKSNQHTLLNAHIVEPLYMGIVTDTGSFRYDTVSAQTHKIVAQMLELGIVHHKIHDKIFNNTSINQLNLWGHATTKKLKLTHNKKIAIIWLSKRELNRFKYQQGDLEGLVNIGLSINGVKVSVLLSQQDNKVRLSFRGSEGWSVNQIASEQFNGGGHKFAAGGTSTQSLQETLNTLEQQIPKYFLL